MTEQEILEQIALGEDSQRQFKREIKHPDTLVKEFTALSNTKGGNIFIGIEEKKGPSEVSGLSDEQVWKFNQWISGAANIVKPACYPITENIKIEGKTVIIVRIPEGTMKPYLTQDGVCFVKSGADTVNASPQQMLRMFQQSGMFYFDEMLTTAPAEDDLNRAYFINFFNKVYGHSPEDEGVKYPQLLENMNLAKDGKFNLSGLLLFASRPQKYRSDAVINAVSFYGEQIEDTRFKSRNLIGGNLEDQLDGALAFIKNEIRFVQPDKEFNTTGKPEISTVAIQEALVNALLHRDYGKTADIRLLIFSDRLEIVSPGSLPNHLTIEHIRHGNSIKRNPTLCSFGVRVLPYTGLGSGVLRIIKEEPETQFINDSEGEQFKVIFKRIL